MNMKKILFVVFVVLFTSCARWSVSRQVKRFNGSEIVFPSSLKLVEGTNPYYKIYEKPNGSLVYWFDENECSICRLSNMAEMRKLFNLCRDSLQGVDIRLIFSPSFSNKESFMEFLEDSEREFSVYVDESNLFGKINYVIPKDRQYHTFLLDKDNKVLLAGNPLLGPTIWNLYRTIMFSLSNNNGSLIP